MKTTFSRMFSVFAVVILLCLLLFGLSSRVMLTSLLGREKRDSLRESAQVLTNLASA